MIHQVWFVCEIIDWLVPRMHSYRTPKQFYDEWPWHIVKGHRAIWM